MFDFPQPGELFRSAGFPDVRVVGILADGIPWEMPYRCPTLVWDPYRRTYTILIRIISDGRIVEIPLARFLREFSCDRPDIFKRNPEHRHIVLKDIAADPELQKRRDKNINHYPQDIIPVRRYVPVVQKWRHIPGTEREIKPDNSYRHYL
ncbi:hypothetical protein E7V08_01535 [Escherichia coli]|uniref:hypothetical protein n=1 Tax=Escherichia coli TaxID=562 RepID=UPI002543ED3F|nr:hypothetical protein [Escherichia coli]MDI4359117.1 hypothetical protein [Escherichia coli]MDI4416289.1 hypothetical protein [Escherichia coli]